MERKIILGESNVQDDKLEYGLSLRKRKNKSKDKNKDKNKKKKKMEK